MFTCRMSLSDSLFAAGATSGLPRRERLLEIREIA
jgi:hypothetical protein